MLVAPLEIVQQPAGRAARWTAPPGPGPRRTGAVARRRPSGAAGPWVDAGRRHEPVDFTEPTPGRAGRGPTAASGCAAIRIRGRERAARGRRSSGRAWRRTRPAGLGEESSSSSLLLPTPASPATTVKSASPPRASCQRARSSPSSCSRPSSGTRLPAGTLLAGTLLAGAVPARAVPAGVRPRARTRPKRAAELWPPSARRTALRAGDRLEGRRATAGGAAAQGRRAGSAGAGRVCAGGTGAGGPGGGRTRRGCSGSAAAARIRRWSPGPARPQAHAPESRCTGGRSAGPRPGLRTAPAIAASPVPDLLKRLEIDPAAVPARSPRRRHRRSARP